MKYDQNLLHESDIRLWKHGEFPMPEWVLNCIVGGIEANGTFIAQTELGSSRMHLGHAIIEQSGRIWVKAPEDIFDFIEGLRLRGEPAITNIGPGKRHQFGAQSSKKSKSSAKTARSPKFAAAIGSLPSIEWVHLERLSVDDAYQRSTKNESSQRLITSIAAKFDWRLCAPLVVSRRANETLTIIDGQHRWMAACLRNDIPQLPCCIFSYKNMEEEARMFILANRARKPINRLDDYFAAVAAGDEDALEIQQIVNDAGLTIARNISAPSWRPGEVSFTSAIAHSIRRHGPAITSGVLTNMAIAFPGQKN